MSSASSSGYGSQAVSSTNLTNEDSFSIRSISMDGTPDLEMKVTTINDSKLISDEKLNIENSLVLEENCNNDYMINGTNYEINNSSQEVFACSESLNDSSCVIMTVNTPGKVVRRTKKNHKVSSHRERASFPQVRPYVCESKAAHHLESSLISNNTNLDCPDDKTQGNNLI